MGKLILMTAVAVTLLVGGTAVAKETTEGAPKEKKICTVDRETKSRIPKKICRTRAELQVKSVQDDLDDAVGRLRTTGRTE